MTALESSTLAEDLERDGFAVIEAFFDPRTDIEPIRHGIARLIALVAEDNAVTITDRGGAFDAGYRELITHDRRLGGIVYDAVKQLPAFMRLACDPRLENLVGGLRPGAFPAIAGSGFGIRIDNPGEDRFRASWHQEYPGQLRSPTGVVIWSPLVPVDPISGPVELCVGSHRDGVLAVSVDDAVAGQSGAYALRLADPGAPARFEQVAPCTQPGDVVVIDFRTIHRSGTNTSNRARWSMQFRWFDFLEPTGRSIGWAGSFASGRDFSTIHPELLVGGR